MPRGRRSSLARRRGGDPRRRARSAPSPVPVPASAPSATPTSSGPSRQGVPLTVQVYLVQGDHLARLTQHRAARGRAGAVLRRPGHARSPRRWRRPGSAVRCRSPARPLRGVVDDDGVARIELPTGFERISVHEQSLAMAQLVFTVTANSLAHERPARAGHPRAADARPERPAGHAAGHARGLRGIQPSGLGCANAVHPRPRGRGAALGRARAPTMGRPVGPRDRVDGPRRPLLRPDQQRPRLLPLADRGAHPRPRAGPGLRGALEGRRRPGRPRSRRRAAPCAQDPRPAAADRPARRCGRGPAWCSGR